MLFFSIWEIIDILIMTIAIGYIFSNYISIPRSYEDKPYDPLEQYTKPKSLWKIQMLDVIIVIGPAIILHEFGHKFVALAFGATATFKAAYIFLIIAIILRYFNSPFIFLVPAYVAWSGIVTPVDAIWIALAGPAVNALLWGLSKLALKYKWLPKKYDHYLILSAKVNGFLAIFNMIPIPGFDGFHVFANLFSLFF
jgi:Zn-dependent protease